MLGVFWVQLKALVWKNWIVLSRHPLLTILRCFILPVAFGTLLALAPVIFNRLNNYGLGTAVPVQTLQSQFDGKTTLIWADNTDGNSSPTPKEVVSRLTAKFTPLQRAAVKEVNASDIFASCPQNWRGFTQCFAAIEFADIPSLNGSSGTLVNYTIYGDVGLEYINVEKHTSDFEQRILPLQWEIDKAIIEAQTHVEQKTPLEWPFTQQSNEGQLKAIRLSYNRGIRNIVGFAFFLTFIGISFQLPGAFSNERALLITEHMKAMGLSDSARIISWHLAISLTYLPAWVIVTLIWRVHVFTKTNTGFLLVLHILLGLVLASYSLFIAVPFGKSPQLAAVVSTFLAILFTIMGLVVKAGPSGVLFVLSLLFPPSFYMFALTALTGYENRDLRTNLLKGDPDKGVVMLPILIAAIIDVFLWPYLALVLERYLYDAPIPRKSRFWRPKDLNDDHITLREDTAISIRDLTKIYKSSKLKFSSKKDVTAVSGLSLDIPKTGIFVLLGSNGAGKSTLLSVVAGITGITSGTVTFSGGTPRAPPGTLGIVPQKNVLFPELSCLQTLRVWKAVKCLENRQSHRSETEEDLVALLRDCDLGGKINDRASTLSGGQKRKLQLAIGLVGGSNILLVDECTSGVDPLSRRALWKTLASYREDRCIVFTTHFLDEADLLANQIAILAPPGKVVANGSPVALKRDLGEGYSIQATFSAPVDTGTAGGLVAAALLTRVKEVTPSAYLESSSQYKASYHLKTRDTVMMQQVLELFDTEIQHERIKSYDILGTTIEDIFLDLMSKNQHEASDEVTIESPDTPPPAESVTPGDIPTGTTIPSLQQAFTIFYKRLLIARRSWLMPALTFFIAVCGACVPLIFIKNHRSSCITRFQSISPVPLFLPALRNTDDFLFLPSDSILESPPGIIRSLGYPATTLPVFDIANNTSFIDTIKTNYRNFSYGGISMDMNTGESLVAWEASPPGVLGPSTLNLATNLLYNRALNSTIGSQRIPRLIEANYASFPFMEFKPMIEPSRWAFYFGAAMAVYPAFFAMYVSRERRSSVQAMQFSNGLTNPIALWLGHLMFDALIVLAISTVITVIFAAGANQQLKGLGFLWFILVQYGITGALFAYCISLFTSSPLAAFATAAGYQIVVFILYLVSYSIVLTFAPSSETSRLFTITHFSISIFAPVTSVARAGLISVNLYSLLCDGTHAVNSSSLGSITKFGGPILYLFIYMFVLLAILVCVDSGSRVPRRRNNTASFNNGSAPPTSEKDVTPDARAVAASGDLLQVLNISKSYGGKQVLDDISLGVSKGTVFALLGPNGAGKTTTFNIIRGDVLPDAGQIMINGSSVISHPRITRSYLGVCPQFSTIDSQLTVREHLLVYGRLKGIRPGAELNRSIEAVLQGTSLTVYADRLANKLSGGNQKKLSLAIALIGNPAVLLIDEFSTGIDPKMKRDLWQTLRRAASGKAVIITTHSMEEASALASNVGILAKRMLAVGTVESLSSRYAAYEVQFSCRNQEEVMKARRIMSQIPGSRMADDVTTRFEVPVASLGEQALSKIFNLLASHDDSIEYSVEKATMESVFIKVIRENNVQEEDDEPRSGWRKLSWC